MRPYSVFPSNRACCARGRIQRSDFAKRAAHQHGNGGRRLHLRASGPQQRGRAIYELSAVDENGLFCPVAEEYVDLSIENGRIIGVGNGDPACLDPRAAPSCGGSSLPALLPYERNRVVQHAAEGSQRSPQPPRLAGNRVRRKRLRGRRAPRGQILRQSGAR